MIKCVKYGTVEKSLKARMEHLKKRFQNDHNSLFMEKLLIEKRFGIDARIP